MSTSRKPHTTKRSPRRATPPVSRMSRAQLTFVIVSSLVICSLVGGAFIGLIVSDAFGSLFGGDQTDQPYQDPNADIVAAQETIVAANPDSVEDLLLLANLLGNTRRLGEAIPYYERALELAPDDVAARVAFARALADSGMHADAEFHFRRALDIDPQNQAANYYLAEMYMAESPPRTDEAVALYRRVVEIDPTTLIAERAATRLATLGVATPASIPEATPLVATPTVADQTAS